MVSLSGLASRFLSPSPQTVLENVSAREQDMCNVYAAAAEKSPIMVPEIGDIREVLTQDRRYFHLQDSFRADEVKSTVEALDRKVIGHLVEQGGVQPTPVEDNPVDFERGTLWKRVQDADGAENLKLAAYTSAVRHHDNKFGLDADEIADFLRTDAGFKGFFKTDDDLNAYAEEVRALVVDDYASYNSRSAISFLLHSFPEPDNGSAPDVS